MKRDLLNTVQELLNSYQANAPKKLNVTDIIKEKDLITGDEVIKIYMTRLYDTYKIVLTKKEILEITSILFNEDDQGFKVNSKKNKLNKTLIKLFKPYF